MVFIIKYNDGASYLYDASEKLADSEMMISANTAEDAVSAFLLCRPGCRVNEVSMAMPEISNLAT